MTSEKVTVFLRRNRKIILVILVVILITSAVNFLFIGGVFNSGKNPETSPSLTPTASSTQTTGPTSTSVPTSTAVPTSTVAPTSTPKPTPTPEPTYVPYVQNYSSFGHIYVTGVDIYGGDLQGNAIPWNTLYIGDSKNASFYVQSTSNVPVILALRVTDWTPSGIGSYLSLSWDYNQAPLNQYQTIFVTLTLTSPASADFANFLVANNVTSFTFDLHIYSTKA
jgi:hypothetical protein